MASSWLGHPSKYGIQSMFVTSTNGRDLVCDLSVAWNGNSLNGKCSLQLCNKQSENDCKISNAISK